MNKGKDTWPYVGSHTLPKMQISEPCARNLDVLGLRWDPKICIVSSTPSGSDAWIRWSVCPENMLWSSLIRSTQLFTLIFFFFLICLFSSHSGVFGGRGGYEKGKNEVLFVDFFAFVSLVQGDISNKIFLRLMSNSLLPMFSSRSFVVLNIILHTNYT